MKFIDLFYFFFGTSDKQFYLRILFHQINRAYNGAYAAIGKTAQPYVYTTTVSR